MKADVCITSNVNKFLVGIKLSAINKSEISRKNIEMNFKVWQSICMWRCVTNYSQCRIVIQN